MGFFGRKPQFRSRGVMDHDRVVVVEVEGGGGAFGLGKTRTEGYFSPDVQEQILTQSVPCGEAMCNPDGTAQIGNRFGRWWYDDTRTVEDNGVSSWL